MFMIPRYLKCIRTQWRRMWIVHERREWGIINISRSNSPLNATLSYASDITLVMEEAEDKISSTNSINTCGWDSSIEWGEILSTSLCRYIIEYRETAWARVPCSQSYRANVSTQRSGENLYPLLWRGYVTLQGLKMGELHGQHTTLLGYLPRPFGSHSIHPIRAYYC